jgi:hypothetical protein
MMSSYGKTDVTFDGERRQILPPPREILPSHPTR